jgi:hypothetical protein
MSSSRITVTVAGRARHESVALLCRPGLDLGALTRLVEQRIGVAVAQVSAFFPPVKGRATSQIVASPF